MKLTLRGASGAALLFGLATGSFGQSASAQQAPPPAPQTVTPAQAAQEAPRAPGGPEQTAPTSDTAAADKVVITGSLIATSAEDAPKPVEIYTSDDMKAQGNPSASDFIRTLSVSAGSSIGFGQSNPQVPAGTGFSSADLRGLGPNATMTLLNGRNQNPANGGYGADLNAIPMAALGAVEVLKDGASSTYGAGAVGGVLNFKTRRDINSPQLSLEKRFYKDGDGNFKLDFLNGWVGDAGNLLISYTYEHEGAMSATERDFSSGPFAQNPSSWSLTAGNPGGFNAISTPFLSGAACTGTVNGNACGTAGNIPVVAVGGASISPLIEDLRGGATAPGGAAATSDCNAIGGQIANQIRPGSLQLSTLGQNTGCVFSFSGYEDLVSETERNQGYAEYNVNISDNMEAHFSAAYSKDDRVQRVSPLGAATNRATDGAIGAANFQCATGATTQYGCGYVIPYQVNSYTIAGQATATAAVNPFIADFMSRTGTSATQLPTGGALYAAADWRPWFAGGNPLFDDGLTHNHTTREQITISSGINGKFSEDGILGSLGLGKFFDGITYDFNAQYLQYQVTLSYPDVFISRLQNALLGYGGPNCNAVDRVATDFSSSQAFNRTIGIQSDTAPGTAGCEWLNPFASSFKNSIMNGAANPQSGDLRNIPLALPTGATPRPLGFQNSPLLADWLTGNKGVEDLYQTTTFNYVSTGELPEALSLPGGPVGWAAGAEWRLVQRNDATFDQNAAEVRMNTQKCPFPDPNVLESNAANGAPNPSQSTQNVGSRGCITGTGAFFGSNFVLAVTGETLPYYHDTQELALFGEVSLPVTDKLNMDVSVRREDYNGGKIGATIFNVSGKYSITDNIYVRGSYGTNFRADTALDLQPGQTTQTNPATARFGSRIIPTFTTVSNDLKPEDDVTQNYGIGYRGDLFGGRLRTSLDWSQTQIKGFVTTATSATIFTNVFGRNDAANTAPTTGIGGSQNNRGFGAPGSAALINSPNQLADCNATLVQYVVFDSPCVRGTTTANNISSVIQARLNGPGFITNGLDYSIDYTYPLFDGDLGFNLTATQTLVYKAQAFIVNGALFQAPSNNLGQANWTHQGAGGTNAGAGVGNSEWKGNASVRWSNEEHMINLRATYDSGRYDERFDPGAVQLLPLTALQNATTNWSTYGIAKKDYLAFDLGYIYTPTWMEGLELQAQVLNVLDRNPPLAQFQLGYASGIGDPRLRTFMLRVQKKF
ncbi:MAG TPA: TonB-dependent receptor [Hyphomonadaceae bacterium]|jgi:outer membrane receptor protein involved in Fe transport|nr:TonB-dependent receptor [Hyphomonadaceae bacterium]